MTTLSSISATELLAQSHNKPIYILDVREPDEYQSCHLPGAINHPLAKIEQGETALIPKTETVYLICQSGFRSDRARKVLESRGYQNLVCVEGGVAACEKIPGAVVKSVSHFPIMRQVQIAAGSLVLLGLFLAKTVNPNFIYLTYFIGCGLIFAGTTGFCGMAKILEKMPWNKIK